VTRTSTSYAVVSPIDASGRLADRSPLRRLRWGPGHPVTIGLHTAAITVVTEHPGRQTIAADGYLRLPAGIRHAIRLRPADRLLAVACPEVDLLMLYPMPVLETMILAHHRASSGEGGP
jgi:hypothetical protein